MTHGNEYFLEYHELLWLDRYFCIYFSITIIFIAIIIVIIIIIIIDIIVNIVVIIIIIIIIIIIWSHVGFYQQICFVFKAWCQQDYSHLKNFSEDSADLYQGSFFVIQ